MGSRRDARPLLAVVAPLVFLVALTLHMAFSREGFDYSPVVSADNPAPAIAAILHGDWATAPHLMPAMGLVSVVIRLPLAWLGGDDVHSTFHWGALACIAPLALLMWRMDRRAAAAGAPISSRALMAILMMAGPAVAFAQRAGHPEEVLTGVLCVAAVLAGMADRRLWAAVLLGLAIGTKQGAIVAVVPVLLSFGGPGLLERRRIVGGLIAAAVVAVCIVPVAAMDTAHYRESSKALAQTRAVYPTSAWWAIAPHSVRQMSAGPGETVTVKTSRLPFGLNRATSTSLALLATALLLLVPAVRRGKADPLALLVVVLTLRCALDPANIDYYVGPSLIALGAWESRRDPGAFPIVTLALTLLTLIVFRSASHAEPAAQFAAWLLATVPLLAVAFAPGAGGRVRVLPGLFPLRRPGAAGRA